jgi:hypothetical protein
MAIGWASAAPLLSKIRILSFITTFETGNGADQLWTTLFDVLTPSLHRVNSDTAEKWRQEEDRMYGLTDREVSFHKSAGEAQLPHTPHFSGGLDPLATLCLDCALAVASGFFALRSWALTAAFRSPWRDCARPSHLSLLLLLTRCGKTANV